MNKMCLINGVVRLHTAVKRLRDLLHRPHTCFAVNSIQVNICTDYMTVSADSNSRKEGVFDDSDLPRHVLLPLY